MEKESISRPLKLKQCAVRQQSKQHCKPTILQQKKWYRTRTVWKRETKELGEQPGEHLVREAGRGAGSTALHCQRPGEGPAQLRSQQQGHAGTGWDRRQGNAEFHELLTGF